MNYPDLDRWWWTSRAALVIQVAVVVAILGAGAYVAVDGLMRLFAK